MKRVMLSSSSEHVCVRLASVMTLTIWFMVCVAGHAQVVGGSLSGAITDSSHGAVAGASIAIANTATGVTTTVTTNAEGIYSAPNLLPGTYQVTVSAAGFQKTVQSGVVLTVGAQQVLNLSLNVGSVNQTVEVTTEAPEIQLASSTINGDISSNTISQLPLNGRSWTSLATLQPGVQSIHDMALTTSHDRLGRGLGDQMSIDGGRPQQNNYLLNGVSINDYSNQAPGSILGENLGADAVSEFTILTSNYSTEYGRSSGGVISAITRSGTNQFHGSAYEYLRNNVFDARNPFDTPTIPAFRRNQFGVSAGGPIIKDKTFIFGDYEGLRETAGLSTFDTVPSRNARLGILADPNNPGQNLPPHTGACPANSTLRDPAAAICIDNNVLPWLQVTNGNQPFFPLPNGSENGDTGSYTPTQSRTNSINYFTIRVDHKFSDKDSLAGVYTYDKAPFLQPDAFNNVLQSNETRRQIATPEWNHVFSATLANSLRFGWSHIYAASPGSATAINPAAASTDPSVAFIPGQSPGTIDLTASGITLLNSGLSTATPAFFAWNSYQVYDNLFLTKGIHSLKFGGNVERILLTESDCGNCGGTLTYGALTDFLTNTPGPGYQVIADLMPTAKITRETLFGVYVQDDIRLRSNLTINAGLRYEMATVPSEIHGHISTIDSVDGSQIFCGAASPTSGATCNIRNPIIANPSRRNFEPRVGFSWDPFRNGKTAIRGGFGMFDVQIFAVNLRGGVGAFPFENAPTASFGSPLVQPGDFPSAGLTRLFANFATDNTAAHLYDIEPNPKRNYVMQWNLNIQREVAPNTTFMIAYVGSRGVHNLFVTDNSNIVLPAAKTPEGYLWPIPNTAPVPAGGTCADGSTPNPGCPWPTVNQSFGRVSEVRWNSDSIFHALELQVSKRMSHGLEAQVSYTYGRSEDTSSGSTDGDQFLNGVTSLLFFDKASRRGPSDFDVPHNFIASYTWNIPSPKSASGILGVASSGWEFGGIFQVSNGTPFTPLIGGDPLGMSGDAFDIPDRVPGCQPAHGGFSYLGPNPAKCFSLPMATPDIAAQCTPFTGPAGLGTCANLMGNAGRNSVIGPRIVNFDMSLVKNTHVTRISESFNVQFRAEVFNIFNHANFNSPTDHNVIFDATGALADSNVGQTSHTATTSRQMQLALKLVW